MSVDYQYNDEVQFYPNDIEEEITVIKYEIEKKYTDCKSLFQYIIQYVFQMKDKLYLDQDKETIDNSINLLILFKWSEDLLGQSQYFDNDEIRVNLYQNGTLFQYYVEIEQNKCDNCGKILQVYQIGCNHNYCISCYEKHIIQQMDNIQSSKVKCLHLQCQITIPYQLIQILSNEVQAKYRKLLCKSYLENNNDYTVCFTNECQNINQKSQNIYCSECQQLFCLKCKKTSHFPMSCDQAEIWLNKVNQINYYTKKQGFYQFCYNCKERCQFFNSDWNLVNCQCGVDFCNQCGYNHEIFFENQQIACQFIEESMLKNWETIHVVILYKFKHYHEKFKNFQEKIQSLSKLQALFLQKQKYKVGVPDISSSFKTILELQNIILYMIPHYQYYYPEKWEQIIKNKYVNLDYYDTCISKQNSNFDQYLKTVNNNMNQLENDSEIYDKLLQVINEIYKMDQELIFEKNQLIPEIEQNK